SFPGPPKIVSLLPSPDRESLPAKPHITSEPDVPFNVSGPFVPTIVQLCPVTVDVFDEELFAACPSGAADETEATFVTVPAVVGYVTIVMSADAPLVKPPRSHVTIPLDSEHDPCVVDVLE